VGRFTLHQGENAHKSIEFFIKDSSTEVVPGKNGLISLLLEKPALLGEFSPLRTCENLGTENQRPRNSTSPIQKSYATMFMGEIEDKRVPPVCMCEC
jgi:hypothetical protein